MDHRYSSCMPLPETIAIRFTEEDAGYVTVRPVVKQRFRLAELTDMILSVAGKNVSRVQQLFRAGTVVYNGYRYWWDGFACKVDEIAALLAPFPDDDPTRPFETASVTCVFLEIGGGTQRSLIGIARQEASEKRLFRKRSPWDILRNATAESAPRYEKYSYADRADLYRLPLSLETAAFLLNELRKASGTASRRFSLFHPAGAFFGEIIVPLFEETR
jgi:hypothetical protein